MEKPVSSMMTKSVWTVQSEDTVEKIDEVLNSRRLSSVPVVDAKGKIFGIVSARDLVLFHSMRKNPKVVRAWEMCTFDPIQVKPDASIRDVAAMMVEHKIHHIVVTENGSVVGFVSSLDFVRQYLEVTKDRPRLGPP
jgi:CBS domain-containing protein